MNKRILVIITTLALLLSISIVTIGTAGPIPGGELVLLWATEPDILDPHRTTLTVSNWVHSRIGDRLVTVDHNLNIVPSLAKSWDVSEDGLIWTFHLRRGVRFHDGQPLNADAVVFTIPRFIRMSPVGWRLAPVQEVKAIDDYTVEFRLARTYPIFLHKLAMIYSSILSPAAVEKYGADYGRVAAIGTGPFKFYEWITGERLVLVRNEEYTWGPAHVANKGPAHLERITLRFIPEAIARILELEIGVGTMTFDVPTIDVSRLVKDPDIQVLKAPGFGLAYMALNVEDRFLADVRVRRAINHAIDKEMIVEAVLEGLAFVAHGTLSPQHTYFWEGVKEFAFQYDPKKANQLLTEAGWILGPDGIRVHKETVERLAPVLWTSVVEPWPTLAVVIAAQLQKIGVDLQIVTMETGTLLARRPEGKHSIFMLAHTWPHGCGTLIFHFQGRRPTNSARFADPRVDELLIIATTSIDAKERVAAMNEIQRIVLEEAVHVSLYHTMSIWGATLDVKNLDLVFAHRWLSAEILAMDVYVEE